mmetsp:Transcript_55/g.102  ORF Transcript_55/g.102 Transcript_55/m.102 type:complete len:266 (+) Transcript_55:273-1070(+)|eukprot:CAMPEP_0176496400 /NCGR_PEP_ID=MMETSP0200_2-20121128/11171_1 /TAXON_ID=947934 /ORGANISM="Chaetoceros sp., Strain GSL56" /LENGTH=265 /DNA_ID=CAMNT_0017894345 /DNA_START=203 /DNA_END=1000 /DNA_ORIENTATION=+
MIDFDTSYDGSSIRTKGGADSRIGSTILAPMTIKQEKDYNDDEYHVFAESLLYLLSRSEQKDSPAFVEARASILRTILDRDQDYIHVEQNNELVNRFEKRNPDLLKVWLAVRRASTLHEKRKVMRQKQQQEAKNLILKTDTLDTYSSTSADVYSDEVEPDLLLIDDDDDELASSSSCHSRNCMNIRTSSSNNTMKSSIPSLPRRRAKQQDSTTTITTAGVSSRMMVTKKRRTRSRTTSTIVSSVVIIVEEKEEINGTSIEMFISR